MRFVLTGFLFLMGLAAQAQWAGRILDAKTREPLSFTNITWNGSREGTLTDLDGKFSLTALPPGPLTVSRVGYEPKTLPEGFLQPGLLKDVLLKEREVSGATAIIRAGDNPAHRIIRAAIQHREGNNPEKRQGFTYRSYNKFVFDGVGSAKLDSSRILDSVARDTLTLAKTDTGSQELRSFLNKSHFMLIETVTERKFRAPDRSREQVLSSRVSGLKNPLFMVLASQMQSFSFYTDYISIFNTNYLNPVAPGSIGRYFYELADTLYEGQDTVFAIAFRPLKGKNFTGMRGILYINTDRYAIENVVAYPAQAGSIAGKIQQQYTRVRGQWFPHELSTQLTFSTIKIGRYYPQGLGHSYIREVNPDTLVPRRAFDGTEFVLPTGPTNDELIARYRLDTLTAKEKETYRRIDSLGKAEKLDQKLALFMALSSSQIPIGPISLDLLRFLAVNQLEKVRLGVGAHTNDRFSQKWRLGGYAGYGLRDMRWKYGADAYYQPGGKFGRFRAFATFDHDLRQSASVTFLQPNIDLVQAGLYQLQYSLFDYLNGYRLGVRQRMFKYLTTELALSHEEREPTYAYRFTPLATAEGVAPRFRITEVQLRFRYALREHIVQTPLGDVSTGSKYPIAYLNLTRAQQGLLGGTLGYHQVEVRLEQLARLRNIGKLSITAMAGLTDRAVPFPFLYNGMGTVPVHQKKYQLSAAVDNTFQTMGTREFAGDQFASLFVHHRFGTLLFKSKYFAPALGVVGAAGFGSIRGRELHEGLTFKTLDRGYYEAGIDLANVVKLTSLGLGLGAYYRMGPNQLPTIKQNVAVKLVISSIFSGDM